MYENLTSDLRKKQKLSTFGQGFIEKDPTLRGYLRQIDIEDIFRK